MRDTSDSLKTGWLFYPERELYERRYIDLSAGKQYLDDGFGSLDYRCVCAECRGEFGLAGLGSSRDEITLPPLDLRAKEARVRIVEGDPYARAYRLAADEIDAYLEGLGVLPAIIGAAASLASQFLSSGIFTDRSKIPCEGGRHASRAAMVAQGNVTWVAAYSDIANATYTDFSTYPFKTPKTERGKTANVMAYIAAGNPCQEGSAAAQWLKANLAKIMEEEGVVPPEPTPAPIPTPIPGPVLPPVPAPMPMPVPTPGMPYPYPYPYPPAPYPYPMPGFPPPAPAPVPVPAAVKEKGIEDYLPWIIAGVALLS